MERVKYGRDLRENLKDPIYRLFYEADSSSPKDLSISFTDWKYEAKRVFPDVTDDVI